MGGRGSGRRRTDPVKRFWSYVNKRDDGCWDWLGAPRSGRDSTGSFWDGVQPVRITHFTWELVNPKLPKGARLSHRCGNKMCVNPDHLYITNPTLQETT